MSHSEENPYAAPQTSSANDDAQNLHASLAKPIVVEGAMTYWEYRRAIMLVAGQRSAIAYYFSSLMSLVMLAIFVAIFGSLAVRITGASISLSSWATGVCCLLFVSAIRFAVEALQYRRAAHQQGVFSVFRFSIEEAGCCYETTGQSDDPIRLPWERRDTVWLDDEMLILDCVRIFVVLPKRLFGVEEWEAACAFLPSRLKLGVYMRTGRPSESR